MMRTGYGGMCVGYGDNSVENARADFEEQEAMAKGRVEFDMPRSVSRSRFASVVGTLLKRTVRDKRNTISVEYFSSMTRPLRVTVFGDDVWELLEAAWIMYEWGCGVAAQKSYVCPAPLTVSCRRHPGGHIEEGTRNTDGHWRWARWQE